MLKTKIIFLILGILEGLPILAYPFALIASIMGLAGFERGIHEPLWKVALTLFFHIVIILYPFIYILCVFFGFGILRNKGQMSLAWIAMLFPFILLTINALLFQLLS